MCWSSDQDLISSSQCPSPHASIRRRCPCCRWLVAAAGQPCQGEEPEGQREAQRLPARIPVVALSAGGSRPLQKAPEGSMASWRQEGRHPLCPPALSSWWRPPCSPLPRPAAPSCAVVHVSSGSLQVLLAGNCNKVCFARKLLLDHKNSHCSLYQKPGALPPDCFFPPTRL